MRLVLIMLVSAILGVAIASTADDPLANDARAAMEKATSFMRSLAANGGYLWRYSEDLKQRAGETEATPTQIWIQPPGTPSMGLAFLHAFQVTREARYLDAARGAAQALAWGQLESGGWDYRVDFDPAGSQRWYRRADRGKLSADEAATRANSSTLDDDNTQSALRFLLAYLGERKNANRDAGDQEIAQALEYGLEGLLSAQYPNGAWPQRFDSKPYASAAFPIRRAQLVRNYPRDWPNANYRGFYTFNDNTIRDCVVTVLQAHKQFGDARFRDAAKQAGDFMILAQLPAPQPAWAQQYNANMEPVWARRFEPPSVCSGESAGVMRSLVDLYLLTGEEKYLRPIPAAIDWFNRSQISPNTWARFYEMGTNRPLYFTRDYKLVYTDNDLPTHYSFQSSYGVRGAIAHYEDVKRIGRDAYLQANAPRTPTAQQKASRRETLAPRTREVIAGLDDKGRWLTNGWIQTRTFIANMETLCSYLEAAK